MTSNGYYSKQNLDGLHAYLKINENIYELENMNLKLQNQFP